MLCMNTQDDGGRFIDFFNVPKEIVSWELNVGLSTANTSVDEVKCGVGARGLTEESLQPSASCKIFV